MKAAIATISLLAISGVLPAFGDALCVSGNLSSLIGTTCDIGSLQFTFYGWGAGVYTYDSNTRTYTYGTAPTPDEFMLTVLSDGFTLTGATQSVVGVDNSGPRIRRPTPG